MNLRWAVGETSRNLRRFISPAFAADRSQAEHQVSDERQFTVSPEQVVPHSWFHLSESSARPTQLLAGECSTAWLMFAWQETFFALIHLRSGRVFEWAKDEGLSLAANSFCEFLARYADDLWNDKHTLVRDDANEEEAEESRSWVWE